MLLDIQGDMNAIKNTKNQQALYIVQYPDEKDLFKELRDVFTETEFRIVKALIPEMKVIEVHKDNKVYNDRISSKNWREKIGA